MNDEIILSRDGVTVAFDEPRCDGKGCLESYAVSVETPGLSARVRVENPPYGSSPAAFFAELAKQWRGWKGEKRWGSMEGELDLAAVSDSTGHVRLTVRMRPDAYPAVWSATASVLIEAGQLEGLERRFAEFFVFAAQS